MSRAIEVSDEQYRVMNDMRKVVTTGKRTQIEPFKIVVQKLLDAYVAASKD
jgi:hypothetical protein